MEFFNLFETKKRIKYVRTKLNISKMELENEGIISRRQLQRIEDIGDKAFLSLPKLMDLARFFDVSMDYLLGISDDFSGNKINNYKHVLQTIINILDKKLVEFDVNQSSTSFFCIKSYDKVIIDFFSKYIKILDIKSSVDNKIYENVLDNLLEKYNFKIK